MARSETAKKREHDDLLSVMEKKGSCVRSDEDIYGWIDYEAEKHIRDYVRGEKGKTTLVESCSWKLHPDATWEEETLSLFEDTFSDNSTAYVVNAYPASCACGQYTDKTLRYDGDLSSFLSLIFKDEPA